MNPCDMMGMSYIECSWCVLGYQVAIVSEAGNLTSYNGRCGEGPPANHIHTARVQCGAALLCVRCGVTLCAV